MRTDTLFYRLFKERPQLVLELAELPVAPYTWRAEEVKETAFRLDGVLLPPAGSTDLPVVFVEIQFRPDPVFYARWFSEIFLYLYRRKVSRWRAIVIFSRESLDKGDDGAYTELLASPRVQRVHLKEDLARFTAPSIGIRLIGLILARRREALAQARDLVKDSDATDRPWVQELVEAILIYKLPQLSWEDIKMLFDVNDPQIRKSRAYQEAFADGRNEGRNEGRDEGRQGEAAAILLRQLRRRFGRLPPQHEARIQALAVDTLEDLAEGILDFASLAELATWLDQHG